MIISDAQHLDGSQVLPLTEFQSGVRIFQGLGGAFDLLDVGIGDVQFSALTRAGLASTTRQPEWISGLDVSTVTIVLKLRWCGLQAPTEHLSAQTSSLDAG